jgi:outer membrane protein TolC
VSLAQSQYREGLADFQAVLDSERAVASLEDELALSDGASAAHAIELFKALGGDWESGMAPSAGRRDAKAPE